MYVSAESPFCTQPTRPTVPPPFFWASSRLTIAASDIGESIAALNNAKDSAALSRFGIAVLLPLQLQIQSLTLKRSCRNGQPRAKPRSSASLRGHAPDNLLMT